MFLPEIVAIYDLIYVHFKCRQLPLMFLPATFVPDWHINAADYQAE